MSNNNANLFDTPYKFFGEALDKVLANNNLSKKWLAEKLAKDDENVAHKQSQISRWVNKGQVPDTRTRLEICKILDISIDMRRDGVWVITPASLDQKVDEYEQMLSSQGLSDTAQAELVSYLQARLESVSKELVELSRLLSSIRPK